MGSWDVMVCRVVKGSRSKVTHRSHLIEDKLE